MDRRAGCGRATIPPTVATDAELYVVIEVAEIAPRDVRPLAAGVACRSDIPAAVAADTGLGLVPGDPLVKGSVTDRVTAPLRMLLAEKAPAARLGHPPARFVADLAVVVVGSESGALLLRDRPSALRLPDLGAMLGRQSLAAMLMTEDVAVGLTFDVPTAAAAPWRNGCRVSTAAFAEFHEVVSGTSWSYRRSAPQALQRLSQVSTSHSSWVRSSHVPSV
jgi:hypothetical protein